MTPRFKKTGLKFFCFGLLTLLVGCASSPTTQTNPSPTPSPSPTPTPVIIETKSLTPGSINLTPGQTISPIAENLVFQGDGNLVLYNANGKALWATGSTGECGIDPQSANFQSDGNLVIYNRRGACWASWTNGIGQQLIISESDPYVKILDGSGKVLFTQSSAKNNIVQPPIVFPPVPTRDQVLGMKISFQGLTVKTVQFGTIPWFEPGIVSLNADDRQSVYAAKKAAGDTHLILGFSTGGILYDEPGNPFQQFIQPDYEANPSLFLSLVEEIILNGFVPVIAFDGDDADNPEHGYPNALRQLPILVSLMKTSKYADLNSYVLYARLWDGVFYGSSPENIKAFGAAFRALLPNGYLAIEHNTGHIPVGGGPGDYAPGGKMVDYDVIMSEFDNGTATASTANDSIWQVVGRLLGPNWVRPPEMPASDDSLHPPWYLAPGNSRGPYYAVAFEFDEYRWVRGQVSDAQMKTERAYMRQIGYQWGDLRP